MDGQTCAVKYAQVWPHNEGRFHHRRCDLLAGVQTLGLHLGGDCDRQRDGIRPGLAIPACTNAAATNPNEARFKFQLARALNAKDAEGALKARPIYEALAAQGHVQAMYHAARTYERYTDKKSEFDSIDTVQATRYYQAATAQGFVPAMLPLAAAYAHGSGVEKSDTKSFELRLKAAEAGYPPAMTYVATSYEYAIGTTMDLDKALQWRLRGLAENDPLAQFKMINAYEEGTGNVPKSPQKAQELLQQSNKSFFLNTVYEKMFQWDAGRFGHAPNIPRGRQKIGRSSGYSVCLLRIPTVGDQTS